LKYLIIYKINLSGWLQTLASGTDWAASIGRLEGQYVDGVFEEFNWNERNV